MDREIFVSANEIPEQTEKQGLGWDKSIKKHAESGMSAARYCREHKINYNMFLYHRRRLRLESSSEDDTTSKFVRMTVSNTGSTRLTLPHGVILETEAIPEAGWIAELVRAL